MMMTKREPISPPTAEDRALAGRVVEWMESLIDSESAEKSDFLWNLSVYAKGGFVTSRGAGLVASAPVAFNRELAKRAERETAVSKWVGAVGDKVNLKVRLVGYHPNDGFYGVTHIQTMVVVEGEHEGAKLKWFGSSRLGRAVPLCDNGGPIPGRVTHKSFEANERVRDVPGLLETAAENGAGPVDGDAFITFWVKGTIKKLDEYKGVKETVLNRCDVTESPDAQKAAKADAAKAKREAVKAAKERRKAFGPPKLVAEFIQTVHIAGAPDEVEARIFEVAAGEYYGEKLVKRYVSIGEGPRTIEAKWEAEKVTTDLEQAERQIGYWGDGNYSSQGLVRKV